MNKNNTISEKCSVIYCNVCGKEFQVENHILKQDLFEVTKEWGYFSEKDLEIHKFNLCEECYDKLVSEFVIPVTIIKTKEVM